MDQSILEQTQAAYEKLDQWVQGRGLAGYDPYDLRGTGTYLWAQKPSRHGFLPAKLLRGAYSVLEDVFPMGMRMLSGVKPSLNAKAMGLFARAYLNTSRAGRDSESMRKAIRCLEWLHSNVSPGYCGPCWGYPFDWQSVVFIPRGTPSSVVSWTVGDAFWKAFQITGERKYLDVCDGVCKFFMDNLNHDKIAADQLCTSYTPIDRMYVLNATLFAGEFLIRIGKEIQNLDYERDGRWIANYVVANQNPDGSWAYYGPEDRKPVSVDHYHTGFVLRMLCSISDTTGDVRYESALKKGFNFYWESLFESTGFPRYFVHKTYPVNIHSIAEALLCLRLFNGRYRDTSERLQMVLKWTLDNMMDESGYFYYMKHQNRTVRIPFMRWSQAWMLLALSEVLHGCNGDGEQVS